MVRSSQAGAPVQVHTVPLQARDFARAAACRQGKPHQDRQAWRTAADQSFRLLARQPAVPLDLAGQELHCVTTAEILKTGRPPMLNTSRPVKAFALLRQASDVLRTDLLGGVTLLIRPLVGDLAGQIYNANELATRMAAAYGMSVPPSALEGFLPRLINAGILLEEPLGQGLTRAVYAAHDSLESVNPQEEREFQEIIDDFLAHATPLLRGAKLDLEPQALTAGFLTHLSTLDFSSIRARPILHGKLSSTIEGPAAREQKALSAELAEGATIDVLVASYISKLREHNPTRLSLLSRVADGALGVELVLDLQAPTSVTRLTTTTVVLDSPIVLSYLDLSSKQDFEAAQVLVSQLVAAGAKIAAFRHSIEEAEGVLSAIQSARHVGEAYGPTIPRLANSVYRAFFDSMRGRIGLLWGQKFEVIQETATHFYKNFTEQEEEDLTHWIQLNLLDRRLTRERDAKSVAETIRRLGGAHVPIARVAACPFIFVTGNRPLQSRAAQYLRDHEIVLKGEFTPIVTDRYIAGLCWLIAGGKAETSPSTARLLANCAAALRLRPELAERTKRFLADLDAEKATHFEALMTNERASQYLMEVTFGNPDVLTALGAEDVFEEAQRRAAEKVAHEKDEFYATRIYELEKRAAEGVAAVEDLQTRLSGASLNVQAKELEALQLGEEARALKGTAENQTADIQRQSAEISELSSAVARLSNEAETVKRNLDRHRHSASIAARQHADRLILGVRLVGAVALFGFVVAISYADKYWVPLLPEGWRYLATVLIIVIQGLLAMAGLSLFADRFITGPLHRWNKKVYEERLLSMGFDPHEIQP